MQEFGGDLSVCFLLTRRVGENQNKESEICSGMK